MDADVAARTALDLAIEAGAIGTAHDARGSAVAGGFAPAAPLPLETTNRLFADERRQLIDRQSLLVKQALRDDDDSASAAQNKRRHFGWLLLCLALAGWWRVSLTAPPIAPVATPAAPRLSALSHVADDAVDASYSDVLEGGDPPYSDGTSGADVGAASAPRRARRAGFGHRYSRTQ